MLIECARCGKLDWHHGSALNPGRIRKGLLCEKCEEIEYAPATTGATSAAPTPTPASTTKSSAVRPAPGRSRP